MMRRTNLLCFATSLVVASLAGGAPEAPTGPVVFTAMGCGPYSPEAAEAMARYLKLENEKATSAFIIHCGDIVTGKNPDWPESEYEKVASLLSEGNKIPTFIVPGDNEWNDQADPDRHWRYWTRHFLEFDKKWAAPGGALVSRQEKRPENFSFVLEGVLFVGINKVGGRVHDLKEWRLRHEDDVDWLAGEMEKHAATTHAAVILAQASALGNTDRFLFGLRKAAVVYRNPVLYLHADGHKWFVNKQEWAANITHVQLDVVDANFPPVQVRVTGDEKEPFQFDRRLEDKEWKVDE